MGATASQTLLAGTSSSDRHPQTATQGHDIGPKVLTRTHPGRLTQRHYRRGQDNVRPGSPTFAWLLIKLEFFFQGAALASESRSTERELFTCLYPLCHPGTGSWASKNPAVLQSRTTGFWYTDAAGWNGWSRKKTSAGSVQPAANSRAVTTGLPVCCPGGRSCPEAEN